LKNGSRSTSFDDQAEMLSVSVDEGAAKPKLVRALFDVEEKSAEVNSEDIGKWYLVVQFIYVRW
jgi:hypothetical protein